MTILLTGATGFVGSALLQKLTQRHFQTLAIVRSEAHLNKEFIVKNINSSTEWKQALQGITTVIHCAARAHIMKDESISPLNEYRQVNTAGTLNLAQQSAELGIKRFIYISSIKVNGEQTALGLPFRPNVDTTPEDPYSLSKYEAEIGLHEIAKITGMEIVIIRPPLVYGAGVKANFLSMLKLVSKGFPLPFGSMTKNHRSLVSVDNLVDLIITCTNHPKAANETFLVSDNDDLSTADMFRRLSLACGKSGYLLPVPEFLFKITFTLIGKAEVYQRLCSSLQVDISHTMKTLDWQPPYSVNEGFIKTAKFYLKSRA